MRRSIFTCTFFFLLIQITNSQISVGVQGGINLATQKFSKELIINGELTLNQYYFFGASIKSKETEKISLILNMQYSQKGYKISSQLGDSEFRGSYLDLLPEIECMVAKNFAASIGAYAGLLIKEEFALNQGKFKKPIIEITEKVDFGVHAALKYYIKDFYILGRYEFGIAKVTDLPFTDGTGSILENSNQRNRVLQLGVGFNFL